MNVFSATNTLNAGSLTHEQVPQVAVAAFCVWVKSCHVEVQDHEDVAEREQKLWCFPPPSITQYILP